MPSILAVIPSFRRTEMLSRAIDSLLAGTLQPSVIWVVTPEIDRDTLDLVQKRGNLAVPVKAVPHSYSGHMGPLKKSSEELAKDNSFEWIYVMDDDAEVSPTLLASLLAATAPDVLAVGSSVQNYLDGIALPRETVSQVGRIDSAGRLHGGFHCAYSGSNDIVEVRHLAGGSMMWRGEAWAGFDWDMRYNEYIARRYEVYLGEEMLQRNPDMKIVYIPAEVLHHFPAPRALGNRRYDLAIHSEAVGFNWTLILRKYKPDLSLWSWLKWWCWGDADSPGILRGMVMLALLKKQTTTRVAAGLKGRIRALKEPVR